MRRLAHWSETLFFYGFDFDFFFKNAPLEAVQLNSPVVAFEQSNGQKDRRLMICLR